ncbi:MAG: TolC family protein, partial [Pararhodobacter sp.]|nr:TolC family protein [Pararhodobacter sp.]
RARLATATSRAVAAGARRDRAEAAYQQVFGARPGSLGRPPRAPALPAGSDDVLISASPRIRGLDASIAAAEADVALARASRFPQIQLRGNATRGAGGRGIDGDVDLLVDYDAGFPGQRAAAIRAAEARLEGIQADRDALARQIRRALADLRADERAGSARIRAAREAVAANEATVDAAREQFSIGRRSLISLLDAQRDLFDASETLINAEFELAVTGYAALALTGDILDAFAITLPAVGDTADTADEGDS